MSQDNTKREDVDEKHSPEEFRQIINEQLKGTTAKERQRSRARIRKALLQGELSDEPVLKHELPLFVQNPNMAAESLFRLIYRELEKNFPSQEEGVDSEEAQEALFLLIGKLYNRFLRSSKKGREIFPQLFEHGKIRVKRPK